MTKLWNHGAAAASPSQTGVWKETTAPFSRSVGAASVRLRKRQTPEKPADPPREPLGRIFAAVETFIPGRQQSDDMAAVFITVCEQQASSG
jgi:hypothetical protein